MKLKYEPKNKDNKDEVLKFSLLTHSLSLFFSPNILSLSCSPHSLTQSHKPPIHLPFSSVSHLYKIDNRSLHTYLSTLKNRLVGLIHSTKTYNQPSMEKTLIGQGSHSHSL